MNALNLLEISRKELKTISSNPYQEGVWILSHVLKTIPTNLYLKRCNGISLENKNIFLNKVEKRKQGWPLDYILEEKWFMGEKFFIQPGVFIPRMDSEIIVRCGLKINNPSLKAIDLGAGVGTLCLSFLQQLPKSRFVAVEINQKSTECLVKNSAFKQVQQRLKILKKDISHVTPEDFLGFLDGHPNLIVANPPYIKPSDKCLSEEVYRFEPPLALFSDQEGMGHICSWFEKSMEFLEPNGRYIFEFGYDQFDKVTSFLKTRKSLKSFSISKDESGINRVAVCIKK